MILNDLIKVKSLTEEDAEIVREILMSRHCQRLTDKKKEKNIEEKNPITLEANYQRKENKRLLKKLPKGAEATNILVSQVNFLDKPLIAFVRLAEARILGDLTEVSIPTRFLFFVFAPKKGDVHAQQLGRALGVLMSDEVGQILDMKIISDNFSSSEKSHTRRNLETI